MTMYDHKSNDLTLSDYDSFCRTSRGKDITKAITYILLNARVSIKNKGFKYLVDGIMILFVNDSKDCMVTKELYPVVAQINGVSSFEVERSIRNTISVAWCNRGVYGAENGFYMFFYKKPTNKEFINYAVYLLEAEFGGDSTNYCD